MRYERKIPLRILTSNWKDYSFTETGKAMGRTGWSEDFELRLGH